MRKKILLSHGFLPIKKGGNNAGWRAVCEFCPPELGLEDSIFFESALSILNQHPRRIVLGCHAKAKYCCCSRC